ncbi:MAG TPA: NUDIX hydrolase [Anaeromyxobacteraceae bacterium]|nr:NUDIX hydrolase [Anaeromyxobacteraceae bacterium]
MRLYWRMVHPRTRGALVAMWNERKLLLVRNSYVRYHSLPGGYVRRGETGRAAAARELFEETGIRAEPLELKLALVERHAWEGKREEIEIFEIEVVEQPVVNVDNREVERAGFFDLQEALALHLYPPVRKLIAGRLAARQ